MTAYDPKSVRAHTQAMAHRLETAAKVLAANGSPAYARKLVEDAAWLRGLGKPPVVQAPPIPWLREEEPGRWNISDRD